MAIVVDDGDTPAYPDYLSFTSSGNSTISMQNSGGNAPIVYYSFDRETWTLWDYSAISLTDGQTVYMYGDNGGDGGQFSKSGSKLSYFTMTGTLTGGGNVMSLLGEDFENYTAVGNYCFNSLFSNNNSIILPPKFPATTLGMMCYGLCFKDSKSITETPYLPANPDERFCYTMMFSGCSNLNKIAVGATTWTSGNASSWVSSVAASGTFFCPSELTIASGNSGIPSGWTRVDL